VRCIGVFYSKPFENFIAPHTTEYRYNYTLQRISIHHSSLKNPLPDGYFSCFDKMLYLLQGIDIKLGYKLGEQWYDYKKGDKRFLEPDISIGIHFSASFTSNYDEHYQNFYSRYNERKNNPKVRKMWDKEQIKLKWKLDRAEIEKNLRQKHFNSGDLIAECDIDRKKYRFVPSPESNRTPESVDDAFCYSNDYTSFFHDWLREVFFKFCWRKYILERDKDGWMKRYEKFKSLTLPEQKAFLTTAEGGMISGFEFRETWEKQLPSGD
jgi:hypothetical protein